MCAEVHCDGLCELLSARDADAAHCCYDAHDALYHGTLLEPAVQDPIDDALAITNQAMLFLTLLGALMLKCIQGFISTGASTKKATTRHSPMECLLRAPQ